MNADSNPLQCHMPVAYGSIQFKNWMPPYDFSLEKSTIESYIVHHWKRLLLPQEPFPVKSVRWTGEIHLRWVKSVTGEIRLPAGVRTDFISPRPSGLDFFHSNAVDFTFASAKISFHYILGHIGGNTPW